ncbi:type I restriction endonuclease subunit R [Candidatus Blastococcus massiliensis]|uniref:type I restriction endonuclease subunit R n=1 Tax=Candidatus Blastococcus massiliensis TaxID=1470358 RepID=UPI0004B5FDAE|nr:DEAD/DEAH box helicase family protein [Candidatus Blastococcus massiliensis]
MAGHTESDFEAAIEAHLLTNGWRHGSPTDYDVALGLDPVQLVEFVQETQPKVWAKLTERHGNAVVPKIVKRIAEEIDAHGVVQVLRRGVKDSGQRIQLAFFRPTHGLAPELVENYAKNRLLVYRQLHHSESSPHQSLDLMLAANGIPVATAELKNHFTGQTVEHAKAQYRDPKQRNPTDRIFARRALAHFAVDPDVVFMTTKLDGPRTVFLPFNQGSDGPGRKGGKGNPVNPHGHRTAYLWEQVWAPDTWLDLLHRYVQEEVPKPGGRKVLFPRYHQWDVVERLTAHAAVHGAGQNYLLQHSAGSGKSNSIAWLAHRLADLHSPSDPATLAAGAGAGIGTDELVFDKVVVITDRRVLDAQLQATISGFEHVQGLLQRIDQDAQQLKAALADAKTKIIITTLQKFPVIAQDATVIGKRVAVIVDEAHSSQSGDAAQGLKKVLGGADPLTAAEADAAGAEAAQADDQDLLVSTITSAVQSTNPVAESAESRGRSPNLSFFAFTATPKGKTLQLFGTPRDEAGTTVYEPFHLYSMRQAIEEGFILDVLANYVTYKRYYRLANGLTSDDPEVEKGKAAVALARFVDLHPSNLDQRAEIIIEHFRTVTAKKIGGQGKAMVVTGSRLHAVRYRAAVQRYLEKKQLTGIRAMVAFSGSVIDPDVPGDAVTESGLNGFPETQTKQRFHDEGQLLIVAEKYQTGFDEPLLHTMYVDKKLEGVKAVQTLSRLNRIHPGKEDTFVLDFRNTADEMREQFAPFYETSWTEETDPNLLYNLQTRIENHHVIDPEEQPRAVTAFLLGNSATHATVSANVDPAVLRAGNLPEHELDDLRDALKAFVRAYAFLGQVMKFTDEELESLYLYGKLLLAKLKDAPTESGAIDLGDTALEFIGHQAGVQTSGSNAPGESSGEIESFTGEGRGSTVEEALMIKLSELIQTFNAAHGIDLSQAEMLQIYVGLPSILSDDEDVQQRAADNTEEQFGLTMGLDKIVGALFQSQEDAHRLIKAVTENETFAAAVQEVISTETWKAARRKHDERAA